MLIGLSKSDIEEEISWKLTTGFHNLDRDEAAKIACAVAAVLVENNEKISLQMRDAGLKFSRNGGERLMRSRQLQPHEAVLLAAREIEATVDDVVVQGIDSARLKQHPLIRSMTNTQLEVACSRAAAAGWFMTGPDFNINGDHFWGMRLSAWGIERADELTRPAWLRAIPSLTRDMRTAVVAGVAGSISTAVTILALQIF